MFHDDNAQVLWLFLVSWVLVVVVGGEKRVGMLVAEGR
jgi:hypothetical protein